MATDSKTNEKLTIPFKTRIALTVISTFTDNAQRLDGTINRRFLRFFDFPAHPNPNPINNVSTSDFVVDPSRNLWFRLFTPHVSGDERIPVVVFFHGGGFAFLSPNARPYDNVCRRFARKLPAYVISVNYRLTPEHRYPAQYDDGFDVLKYLEENHGKILPANADLSRCFFAGDSAGGNIAHNVSIRVCREKRAFTALKLIGLISIQPFFGGEERTESEKLLVGAPLVGTHRTDWCWKALLPEGSNRDHEAVNVSGPNAVDISDLDYPETMVVVAGFDPLKDWQRSYCEWIRLSGKRATLIEYPNMFHAFYIFPELPEAGQLIMRIKDFVAERVASLSAD
ncbi:putative carboxylesterase 18 [Cardamine amara subsp. amara]|uniref:Carboxylesterase 18 n=1 Tax=Cardamine amara subsp. amara TaxID=228776 RepID=A0ABD1A308_CARAN